MELARAEREVRLGPNFEFGSRMGRRMALEDERGLPVKAPMAATKRLLAEFPPSESVLDLRGVLPKMRDVEIWQSAQGLAEERELRKKRTAAAREKSTDAKKKKKTKRGKTTDLEESASLVKWCENHHAAWTDTKKNEDGEGDENASTTTGTSLFPESATERKTLNLSGWRDLGLKPLRALSLSLGPSLTSVDVSKTRVTDADVLGFCARLEELMELKIAGCEEVSNLGLKHVASCCHRTLTRLDAARCQRLTAEGCGWIAGTLGCASPACARLRSLDVSRCPKIDDDGLISLAKGCRKLTFLSIAGNPKVTDVGVVALAKGCSKLRVLDVGDCREIGDKGVRAIGRHLKLLRCLLAPRCGGVKNRGLEAVADGCRQLATLNVAGSKFVSEKALAELASKCLALKTLNVTGCDQITVRSVQALIQGLPCVREATTFFGFVPTPDVLTGTLESQRRLLENRSAKRIVRLFRAFIFRKVAREAVALSKRNQASVVLARVVLRFLVRLRLRKERRVVAELASAGILQRAYRAYRARAECWELTDRKAWYHSRTADALKIQTLYRGHTCRQRDPYSVVAVIRRSRASRRKRLRKTSAVSIQAACRGFLALRRTCVLHQIHARVQDDRDVAAHNVQFVMRSLLAYRELKRRRREKRIRDALLADAARRIVLLFRKIVAEAELERRRKELERKKKLEDQSARTVQRCTRGLFGRMRARIRRAEESKRYSASTRIQSVFRGSRVMSWKHIRINKIAEAVFERQGHEIAFSRESANRRYEEFVGTFGHDSCSEDEDPGPEDDKNWVARTDSAGVTTWFHVETGEQTDENPLSDPVDVELLGCSVKVFWPQMDTWYEGSLATFNKRRRKYRIEYHDGDHEWLDLDRAKDRVQLFDANQQWAMLEFAYRPALEERRDTDKSKKALAQKAAKLEYETRHWEVLPSSEDDGNFDDHLNNLSGLQKHAGGAPRFSADEATPPRWLNALTGEVRELKDDAYDWVESRDNAGNFCFEHFQTGKQLYEDPRFLPPVDGPEIADAKNKCLDDLRFGAYIASAVLDEWAKVQHPGGDPVEQRGLLDTNTNDDATKRQSAVFKRVLAAKTTLRTFSTAMANARTLWLDDDFAKDQELLYFEDVLKHVLDLLGKAEAANEKDREFKRQLIASSKRARQVIVCRNCQHEVPQNKTHCVFCGERCTTWG